MRHGDCRPWYRRLVAWAFGCVCGVGEYPERIYLGLKALERLEAQMGHDAAVALLESDK